MGIYLSLLATPWLECAPENLCKIMATRWREQDGKKHILGVEKQVPGGQVVTWVGHGSPKVGLVGGREPGAEGAGPVIPGREDRSRTRTPGLRQAFTS